MISVLKKHIWRPFKGLEGILNSSSVILPLYFFPLCLESYRNYFFIWIWNMVPQLYICNVISPKFLFSWLTSNHQCLHSSIITSSISNLGIEPLVIFHYANLNNVLGFFLYLCYLITSNLYFDDYFFWWFNFAFIFRSFTVGRRNIISVNICSIWEHGGKTKTISAPSHIHRSSVLWRKQFI